MFNKIVAGALPFFPQRLIWPFSKQYIAGDTVADAIRVSRDLNRSGALVTVDLLGEFITVVTRKISTPLSLRDVREIVRHFRIMAIQETDYHLVQRALDGCEDYGISYWDSLIIATAERAGCKRILSEDLNSGQHYFGAEVVNPFTC